MKTAMILGGLATAALAVAGCEKTQPAQLAKNSAGPSLTAGALPRPRAGLWRQTMSRDARATLGVNTMQICLDAGTDGRASWLGEHAADNLCKSAIGRNSGGAYEVSSSCRLGKGGVIASKVTAQGDFNAAFSVHVDSEVSGAAYGPMNGHHTTDIQSQYLGPCPIGMKPGDVVLANGFKINMDKLRQAKAALAGG